MPHGPAAALPFEDKGEKGCTVSEGGPDDGYETEHGVVHVSRGVDNLHTNPLILVAPRSLRLTLLTSPISPYVTYYSFHWKKGTPFGEDQGDLQQADHGNQLTPNRKFLTQQTINILCSSSTHWPYLLWWSPNSHTCTRSAFLESMQTNESLD
ncbi:hypothetical protein HID58_015217 [Brassica napus]|uniref:Uncharacterized protein n=2 Tax=Brassica TaxID=3705 RepID=A0A3P6CZQ3_BRACM|nr:hypothetical protein HID58_015217 [Brassica napus]CAF2275233.1 unnamed protein product [Brassica napus]CAG7906741.1 unnamed protein product [Brassica rapa]CDY27665.1 BnaUnng00150D [Brassica napus]VDD12819.1 unnamed protein product [Brassica rapa]